jgi:hypothetical protein
MLSWPQPAAHQVKHRATFDVVVLGLLVIVHLLASKDQPVQHGSSAQVQVLGTFTPQCAQLNLKALFYLRDQRPVMSRFRLQCK